MNKHPLYTELMSLIPDSSWIKSNKKERAKLDFHTQQNANFDRETILCLSHGVREFGVLKEIFEDEMLINLVEFKEAIEANSELPQAKKGLTFELHQLVRLFLEAYHKYNMACDGLERCIAMPLLHLQTPTKSQFPQGWKN